MIREEFIMCMIFNTELIPTLTHKEYLLIMYFESITYKDFISISCVDLPSISGGVVSICKNLSDNSHERSNILGDDIPIYQGLCRLFNQVGFSLDILKFYNDNIERLACSSTNMNTINNISMTQKVCTLNGNQYHVFKIDDKYFLCGDEVYIDNNGVYCYVRTHKLYLDKLYVWKNVTNTYQFFNVDMIDKDLPSDIKVDVVGESSIIYEITRNKYEIMVKLSNKEKLFDQLLLSCRQINFNT